MQASASITMQAIAPLITALHPITGARILDVACGAGHASAAVAAQGAKPVGIDLSSNQVALATKLYPNIKFLEADATAIPFGNCEFDAVMSNFGIPHFQDPYAFLCEAYRVLRPGGRLAFTSWVNPDQDLTAAHPCATPGAHFFLFGDAANCERMLGDAGFRVTLVKTIDIGSQVASPDALLDAVIEAVVRAETLLGKQTPESLSAIRKAVRHGIGGDTHDEAFEISMTAVIVSAEKA